MINNRQSGRRRGRGGNGQRPQGGPGRPDNGNRIDNRARGNAAQLLEKYKSLASEAQRQGDRVNTEYYLQFADHYFRVLMETRARFDDGQGGRPPQPAGFEPAYDGGDAGDDYADEGEAIRPGEQMLAAPGDRGGDRGPDRGGERGDRGDRPQPNRERRDRFEARDNRDERRPREPYREQASADQPRAEQPEAVEPAEASRPDAEQAAPRRRGRPRKVVEPAPGAAPESVEADRLPPALGLSAVVANDQDDGGTRQEDDAPAKPRRRRRTGAAEASAAE